MTPSHSDAGNQCTVGSVGDALMETQIGLYKTELISFEAPWRSLAEVELATAEWVAWFNTTRLHSAIGQRVRGHLLRPAPPQRSPSNQPLRSSIKAGAVQADLGVRPYVVPMFPLCVWMRTR